MLVQFDIFVKKYIRLKKAEKSLNNDLVRFFILKQFRAAAHIQQRNRFAQFYATAKFFVNLIRAIE